MRNLPILNVTMTKATTKVKKTLALLAEIRILLQTFFKTQLNTSTKVARRVEYATVITDVPVLPWQPLLKAEMLPYLPILDHQDQVYHTLMISGYRIEFDTIQMYTNCPPLQCPKDI